MALGEHALVDLIRGDVSFAAALGISLAELKKMAELGNAHLAAGRSKDAAKVFDGLCALEPGVAGFHELRGMAHAELGNHDAAEESFTEALQLGDERTRGHAYLQRALVRMRKGAHEAALADFALAGALCDPSDAVLTDTLRVMGGRCAAIVAERAGV
jgi:tetratricopeptide (TPR) repeat protein